MGRKEGPVKKIGFMGVMIAVGCLSTAAYAGDVGFEVEKHTVADGKTVVTITNTLEQPLTILKVTINGRNGGHNCSLVLSQELKGYAPPDFQRGSASFTPPPACGPLRRLDVLVKDDEYTTNRIFRCNAKPDACDAINP